MRSKWQPLLAALARLTPQNVQGEYYLTDVVAHLVAASGRVAALRVADAREALGVNTLAELAVASRLLVARRLEELMADGVSIEDPASTFVGLDVVVEAGAVLRPGTLLEGRTRVAAGASLGPFVRLVDTEVGPGASILDHCLLRECVVGAGASIGPFAHVRPESRVGAKAKVGNFVELKKTRLGDGAKAPHLSYLGDATIGAGANVGAGTITCNYDGTSKHPTRIGDGRIHRQQLDPGGAADDRRRRLRRRRQHASPRMSRRRLGAGPRPAGGEAGLGKEAQRARRPTVRVEVNGRRDSLGTLIACAESSDTWAGAMPLG